MATIVGRAEAMGTKTWTFVWSGLANGDVGSAVENAPVQVACVQFTGDFGTGTAILQGSNDGTVWETVRDFTGTAISLTAPGLRSLGDRPRFIRPSLSGGSAGGLTVTAVGFWA